MRLAKARACNRSARRFSFEFSGPTFAGPASRLAQDAAPAAQWLGPGAFCVLNSSAPAGGSGNGTAPNGTHPDAPALAWGHHAEGGAAPGGFIRPNVKFMDCQLLLDAEMAVSDLPCTVRREGGVIPCN